MVARFQKNMSMQSTRKVSQFGKVAPPQSNTMKGLPGFIKTTQDKSSGGLTNSSGIGPHKPGPIGQKGGSRLGAMDSKKFRGSSDKSYRATSTGPAGRIAGNKSTPIPRGTSNIEGRGKMESLRGKAKFSMER